MARYQLRKVLGAWRLEDTAFKPSEDVTVLYLGQYLNEHNGVMGPPEIFNTPEAAQEFGYRINRLDERGMWLTNPSGGREVPARPGGDPDMVYVWLQHGGGFKLSPLALDIMIERYLPASVAKLNERIAEENGDALAKRTSVTTALVTLAEIHGYGID